MTDWILIFLKGFLAGLFIAAPVGPVAVICVKRAIFYGARGGLAAGLGAAFADAFFGAIVGFGVAVVSNWLLDHQEPIRVVGGIILLGLGLQLLLIKEKPVSEEDDVSPMGLFSTFVTTFMLTITNPITILSFFTVFAALGLAQVQLDYTTAGVLVAGVFSGSAFWWIAISGAVMLARGKIGTSWMTTIKKYSGLIIIGFGLYALASVIF